MNSIEVDAAKLIGFDHIFRTLSFYGYNNYGTVTSGETGSRCFRKWKRPATITRILLITIVGCVIFGVDFYYTMTTATANAATSVTNVTDVTSGGLPLDYVTFWAASYVIRMTSFSLFILVGLNETEVAGFFNDFAVTISRLPLRDKQNRKPEVDLCLQRIVGREVRNGHVAAALLCSAIFIYTLSSFGAYVFLQESQRLTTVQSYCHLVLNLARTLFYTFVFTFSVFAQLWYLLCCRVLLHLWKMFPSVPEVVTYVTPLDCVGFLDYFG